jgi:hypothetical protein
LLARQLLLAHSEKLRDFWCTSSHRVHREHREHRVFYQMQKKLCVLCELCVKPMAT